VAAPFAFGPVLMRPDVRLEEHLEAELVSVLGDRDEIDLPERRITCTKVEVGLVDPPLISKWRDCYPIDTERPQLLERGLRPIGAVAPAGGVHVRERHPADEVAIEVLRGCTEEEQRKEARRSI